MNGSDPTQTATTSETQSSGATIGETSPQSPSDVASTSSQNGTAVGAQAPAPTSDGPPPDPIMNATRTTEAIHNAFLMGWSIQELKSNILLGAMEWQQSSSASDPPPQTGSATGRSATAIPRSLSEIVDMLLQGVLASASTVTSQTMGLPSNLNGSFARTSEWRAKFIRLATVHDQCFPGSTTENTPYDPSPLLLTESRFPFLYPDTSHGLPDYALIGINNSGSVGITDFDDEAHLGRFKLYDVTRRALNCLTLLYMKPEESPVPAILSSFQTQIVESFHHQTQVLDTGSQQNTNAEDTAILAIFQAYLKGALAGPSPDALNDAIKSLSFLIVRFLDSWDGYLRENFYAGGQLQDNELELLAYEASYALSSLSSAIPLITVQENTSKRGSTAGQLLSKLSNSWQNVFTNSCINSIQRQISALGPALDDAYYILKNVPRPVAGGRPDPDLPSNMIHAITYSLNYWQRAAQWICNQNNGAITESAATSTATIQQATTNTTVSIPPVSTTVSTTTTEATTETASMSTTVSTSPSDEIEKPLPLTAQLSRQLCQALLSQTGIWQSLMLGQQTLRSFTTESVTRRILNNIMADFENAAIQEVSDPIQSQAERLRIPMIVVGILVLVIVGGGIVLLALTGQFQSLAAVIALFVGSALTLVSTGLTRVSSTFFPASNQRAAPSLTTANNANLEQQLGRLFDQAGEAIVTAFQDAYTQILIEFDYLNHNVAISYPLIDIFTSSTDFSKVIKDGYYFLTLVAWTKADQKEELDRVARAAFGPLGTLIRQSTDMLPTTKSSAPEPGSKVHA